MTTRLQVGVQLALLAANDDGVHVEGRVRLRPGQIVELVCDTAAPVHHAGRRACVMTWAIARLGRDAPIYRGWCQWR